VHIADRCNALPTRLFFQFLRAFLSGLSCLLSRCFCALARGVVLRRFRGLGYGGGFTCSALFCASFALFQLAFRYAEPIDTRFNQCFGSLLFGGRFGG